VGRVLEGMGEGGCTLPLKTQGERGIYGSGRMRRGDKGRRTHRKEVRMKEERGEALLWTLPDLRR
jgi:hypothetical protein